MQEDRIRNGNELAKLETNGSMLQAYHRIESNYGHQAAARQTKKEILFDSYTAELCLVWAVNGTVIQDVVHACLDKRGPQMRLPASQLRKTSNFN